MLRVGLTGGIGSGKSTVAGRLAGLGAVVVDADRIAREVVAPGTEGLRAVIAEFGPQVRAADGGLDRPALAARVFGDPAARATLDALLHPLIRARSAELVAAAPPDAVVVQDVPLLVEAGMAPSFPLVVVVHADVERRVRRVVEHRGMTEQDARARIAAQATDEQRRAAADVWLDNSGDLDRTIAAVDRLWARRLVPFEENLRHHRRAPRPAPALADPDPHWPAQAERMLAKIALVAGDRALRLDHIGSTSVPGLPAKDVLDLQVVVDDLAAAAAVGDDLVQAGLVRPGGAWWDNGPDGERWDKVIAVNADPGRAVNCHIRPAGLPAWREVLLLRDLLRSEPRWAAEYADLKRGLTTRSWRDADEYADAKTPFVRRALAEARRWADRQESSGGQGWVIPRPDSHDPTS